MLLFFRKEGLSFLLFTLAAAPALADPPADANVFVPVPEADLRDLNPDRPNHTDTPGTVDAGHIQIETGLADFARQWDGDPSATAFSTGQFNLRLGITNSLELNAALNSFTWQRVHGATVQTNSGVGDLSIGGKINLWGNAGSDDVWATALGIKPQLKLPTAGATLGNGHVEFGVEFPFLVNLPSGFHLGLQAVPGLVRNSLNTAYVGGAQLSASVDHGIGTADIYLEYWSQIETGVRPVTQQTLDPGVSYAVSKNLVIDSGVFLGLNRRSTSFEYLGGFTVRY